jgi:hypothetical protein
LFVSDLLLNGINGIIITTTAQQTLPKIEAAAQALEKKIAITENEMAKMKEEVAAKKPSHRRRRTPLAQPI